MKKKVRLLNKFSSSSKMIHFKKGKQEEQGRKKKKKRVYDFVKFLNVTWEPNFRISYYK